MASNTLGRERSCKDNDVHFMREGIFPFLDLSGELRNRIYTFSLSNDEPLTRITVLGLGPKYTERESFRQTVSKTASGEVSGAQKLRALEKRGLCRGNASHGETIRRVTPSLLRTCRQINKEATAFLYAGSFELASKTILNEFVHAIGPQIHFVRSIRVLGRFSSPDLFRRGFYDAGAIEPSVATLLSNANKLHEFVFMLRGFLGDSLSLEESCNAAFNEGRAFLGELVRTKGLTAAAQLLKREHMRHVFSPSEEIVVGHAVKKNLALAQRMLDLDMKPVDGSFDYLSIEVELMRRRRAKQSSHADLKTRARQPKWALGDR